MQRRASWAGLVAAEAEAVGQLRITTSGRPELAGWLRRTPEPADSDELTLKITLAGLVPGTEPNCPGWTR